jgi:hypothetical protein
MNRYLFEYPIDEIDVLIAANIQRILLMIELEQDDIPEETEYESINWDDENPGTSAAFTRLTGANYVDKVQV